MYWALSGIRNHPIAAPLKQVREEARQPFDVSLRGYATQLRYVDRGGGVSLLVPGDPPGLMPVFIEPVGTASELLARDALAFPIPLRLIGPWNCSSSRKA